MSWTVLFHEQFDWQFRELDEDLKDELLAHARLLQEIGPQLGRPTVDTLKGSKHANRKERRFEWGRGVWRTAFAFDPKRRAVLPVSGDKAGTDENRFDKSLIAVADVRLDRYLAALKTVERGGKRKESIRDKKP
jgi:hypothetical protein